MRVGLAAMGLALSAWSCEILELVPDPVLGQDLTRQTTFEVWGVDGREATSPDPHQLNRPTDLALLGDGDQLQFILADRYHHRLVQGLVSDISGDSNAGEAVQGVIPEGAACQSPPFDPTELAFPAVSKVGTTSDGQVVAFGDSILATDNELLSDVRACAPLKDWHYRGVDMVSSTETFDKVLSIESALTAAASSAPALDGAPTIDWDALDPDRAPNVNGTPSVSTLYHLSSNQTLLMAARNVDVWRRDDRLESCPPDCIDTLATERDVRFYTVDPTGLTQVAATTTEFTIILGADYIEVGDTGHAYILNRDDANTFQIQRFTLNSTDGGNLTLSSTIPLSTTLDAQGNRIAGPNDLARNTDDDPSNDILETRYDWVGVKSLAVDHRTTGAGSILYMADTVYGFVAVMMLVDSEFRVCGQLGQLGSDLGELTRPLALRFVDLTDRQLLLVADVGNYRIKQFDVTELRNIVDGGCQAVS